MASMEIVPVDSVADGGVTNEPISEEVFCRRVENAFTPHIGMEFADIEEAVTFYKVYAFGSGFDVRKYTTKKWRDGTIKSKLLVCNRQGYTKTQKQSMNNGEAGYKQERRTRRKRIGCKARLRLFSVNGVLIIDRFHEHHNHELVSVKDREFQKLAKNISNYHKSMIVANSKLNIGATRTYRMCKELVNGFENIGASLNDFKNFHRDIKCFIHERDGQLFIDYFKSMQESSPSFFFDYDVDSDGSLRRAIWADGISRGNYSVFGDAVSYDPTYATNKYKMVFTPFTGVDNHKRSVTFCCALIAKEDTESFNWVFERFLKAMGGKEPAYLITDQDPGIIKAAKHTFKTARHRFCMWHIMNKVPIKYGSSRSDYQDFLKKLNAIIWDDEIEPEEFDSEWGKIMEEHVVGDEEWFKSCFADRRQWVMAHCRDLNMGAIMRTTQRSESANSFFKRFEHKTGTLVEFWMRFSSAIGQQRHNQKRLDNENRQSNPELFTKLAIEADGARVYTHAVFEEFQVEAKYSTSTCSCKGFSVSNNLELTTVKDSRRGRTFDVQFNTVTFEASCTCRMFERQGLLCRHIIWIYSGEGIERIPVTGIARRWTKDAVRGLDLFCNGDIIEDMDIIDGKQIAMTKLWSEVHETVGVLAVRDTEDIDKLSELIREFKEKLKPSVEKLNKEEEIVKLLGCKASNEITILPPKVSKNKGSGKRIVSSKEKAVKIATKPKRMCNNCKQMAHHDKRNCPNKYAERPPPLPEEEEKEEEEEEEDSEEEEEESEEEDEDDDDLSEG